jgi:hypothetical protein
MQFLSFSQTQVLFKKPICKEVPESFRFLTSWSLLCTQDPGKNGDDTIGSLGELASATRRIWARPVAVAGRKRVEVGLGMARARFLRSDGEEWGPATAHGGAPERRPQRLAVRWGEAQGGAGHGTVRSSGLRGNSIGAGLVLGVSGPGVSPTAVWHWRRWAQGRCRHVRARTRPHRPL